MSKFIRFSIIAVLFIVAGSLANVSKFTYTWTPHAGDTVTAVKLKKNYDSIKVGVDRVVDSLNSNSLRYSKGAARVQVDTNGAAAPDDSLNIKWNIIDSVVTLTIGGGAWIGSDVTTIGIKLPESLFPRDESGSYNRRQSIAVYGAGNSYGYENTNHGSFIFGSTNAADLAMIVRRDGAYPEESQVLFGIPFQTIVYSLK